MAFAVYLPQVVGIRSTFSFGSKPGKGKLLGFLPKSRIISDPRGLVEKRLTLSVKVKGTCSTQMSSCPARRSVAVMVTGL